MPYFLKAQSIVIWDPIGLLRCALSLVQKTRATLSTNQMHVLSPQAICKFLIFLRWLLVEYFLGFDGPLSKLCFQFYDTNSSCTLRISCMKIARTFTFDF